MWYYISKRSTQRLIVTKGTVKEKREDRKRGTALSIDKFWDKLGDGGGREGRGCVGDFKTQRVNEHPSMVKTSSAKCIQLSSEAIQVETAL